MLVAEQNIEFTLGVTEDGKVMVNFGDVKVDHITLTDQQARQMADGLHQAAEMVAQGTGGILRVGRDWL